MLNPKSKLPRFRRRPSAALVVASVALFMSLGGASYAAVTLSAGSVGTTQLKNLSVTNPKIAANAIGFRKIAPGSVGTARIVKTDVQLRLKSSCTTGAITSVDVNGKVTCGSTLPSEANTAAASPVTVTSSSTTASTLSLAGGSAYLVTGNPYLTVTPTTVNTAGDQRVIVTCSLSAGPSTTSVATRSVSVDVPAPTSSTQPSTASIPLTVAAPTNANASSAAVTCLVNSDTTTSGTGAGTAAVNPATVTVQAPIYALQTASSTTAAAPATTTTTTTPAA